VRATAHHDGGRAAPADDVVLDQRRRVESVGVDTGAFDPLCQFRAMRFPRIVAAEKAASTAPPSQKWFPTIQLLSISAGPPEVSTAPPWESPPPPVIVKPRRTWLWPAGVGRTATTAVPSPWMTVFVGPAVLSTAMALLPKLIRSRYVPGATRTVSPFAAASIAC
jgi:hypothetical protein